ncbi:VQ motif-containing protein 20-like [Vigna unguiculata]|uniref:VQ motif-containing protein 20-like n=1 Tax=Vigna unguiculata TaxID=3917 RepID=UPI0010172192|nr:VQ motif-containing protein 20-like [Vigna unguiculata]
MAHAKHKFYIYKHTHLSKSLPPSSPHRTITFILFAVSDPIKANSIIDSITITVSRVSDCHLSSKPKAMSPSHFHSKREITSTNNKNTTNGLLPPPLKISKESHFIKKSSPQSSSSSSSSISSSLVNTAMPASSYRPQQQRHPVIIYTHSPKVIHTQPKDFMSLVQKLTGLSRSDSEDEEEDDDNPPPPQQQLKQESGGSLAAVMGDKESDRESMIIVRNEENEASSVLTEENNCSSSMGENQVNSCFMAGEGPIIEPPMTPYVTMMAAPSSTKFVCSSPPLMNYSDSLFFSHNLRTSIPSPATLEGTKDFRDH